MVDRYRISGIGDRGINAHPSDSGEWVRYSAYAALEAQLAEMVKVKSLEWVEIAEGPRCITPCGTYAIHPSAGAYGRPTLSLTGMPGDLFGKFDTIEAAKAAAQADYDRRILSALEATPPAPKVTATTDHDPKLGTTLHLMKQSWESRQPTNSGAPKVTDEMVERGAKKLLLVMPELLRLYPSAAGEVARRDVREVLDAALTAAQEAGKP